MVCRAPHRRIVASVPPSVSIERPVRSIDGIPRSVPMEYRWNAPIEVSIPIERPERSNAPIQIQIEIETGADIGGSVTHTTTSHDSSIDLDRGVQSGRSIWIGVIVRSFVRTDRGIPSIDRSISMAFVWITSTSRDSRKKMRPTGGTPSRAFRTTVRASGGRRERSTRELGSVGRVVRVVRSCRSCRSYVSFVKRDGVRVGG